MPCHTRTACCMHGVGKKASREAAADHGRSKAATRCVKWSCAAYKLNVCSIQVATNIASQHASCMRVWGSQRHWRSAQIPHRHRMAIVIPACEDCHGGFAGVHLRCQCGVVQQNGTHFASCGPYNKDQIHLTALAFVAADMTRRRAVAFLVTVETSKARTSS